MMNLNDNRYNRSAGRSDPKLKIWRYAGLMLTYRCTASCRCCYYNCSPDGEGLMSVETALAAWKSLIDLAGDHARVHITGGEPFLEFDRLCEILEQAHISGFPALDSLETNGAWAAQSSLISPRLQILKKLGLKELKMSWDPFHAEFVLAEPIAELYRKAQEILGPNRVRIRWEKYMDRPVTFQELSQTRTKESLYKLLKEDQCRFTGRCADLIGPLVANQSIDQIRTLNCRNSFLGAKGVHIDPYGNVFSGQCSGMIVGNLIQQHLSDLWTHFNPAADPFWAELFHSGPGAFLARSREKGFQPLNRYASKCHLCTHLRRFFFDKRLFFSIIGPHNCYSI